MYAVLDPLSWYEFGSGGTSIADKRAVECGRGGGRVDLGGLGHVSHVDGGRGEVHAAGAGRAVGRVGLRHLPVGVVEVVVLVVQVTVN